MAASIVNPNIGDLALTDEGTELVRTVLADEVSQRLHVRLKFFKGEWFLNLDAGAPYYQSIFVKGVRDRIIRSVFTDIIRGTEGVSEVLKLDYAVSSARQLTLTFTARLQDGTLFRSTDYAPYVV